MVDNASNRTKVVDALRHELVGPSPAGKEFDTSPELRFSTYAEALGPYRQKDSGEEILTRDSPTKRYGIGVLFPIQVEVDETADRDLEETERLARPEADRVDAVGDSRDLPGSAAERETDDLDLSLANAYQPSAMGISFLVDLPEGSELLVEVSGGRYTRKTVIIDTGAPGYSANGAVNQPRVRTWWLRQPVTLHASFPSSALTDNADRPTKLVARASGANASSVSVSGENLAGLDLHVELLSRPQRGRSRQRLVTVTLVNRFKGAGRRPAPERCLFQSYFRARVLDREGKPIASVLPYPEADTEQLDQEEKGLDLLYRGLQTFATGHGCSADWGADPKVGHADWVAAEVLPNVETPNTTPDIYRQDKTRLTVSMAALAGLLPGDDGEDALDEVLIRYASWIQDREAEMREPSFPSRHLEAAAANISQCKRVLDRMRQGLSYVRSDPKARRAFQLANHAVLLQQVIARESPRPASLDKTTNRTVFQEPLREPDPLSPPPNRGTWRPFQIAFLLATVRSTAQADDADRRAVELIWFPTGGGKTEAYLGLTAFAAFKRRLEDPKDTGVHVLMRYTLRLLTAQQFQRASGLLCAMEYLRRTQSDDLGQGPFSAGIWLGSETTPNTRADAVASLNRFRNSARADNPFLLGQCPWCGAQFGRVERDRRGSSVKYVVIGYTRKAGTVKFACPDEACFFKDELPILVVDEDIYDTPPTLVIGTIDKFAMLAWRPEARALFGIDSDGRRTSSPPGLVIQDELHLIAGPLGSLAGLYETVIEELCTDRRGVYPVSPKIVSSTATIRRYQQQILSLYARETAYLFPPPGLDASDSFFASYDTGPGRMYVGVHAVSLGSVQTEWVRTFAALIQAPMPLPENERDPWWTMLVFFNSIREMGTAHTLLQSDVPDYNKVIWERMGTDASGKRWPSAARVFELTGGLQSDQISDAIAQLQMTYGSKQTPVGVCLASSVIEVGIDITRLALMVVAGQPKTTAQYIQVTGRVGRSKDRPGLVVTMYSPSKPRDRSHFERFRSYHQRLYAHVEPTSVTPFSAPALDRALHAVLVAYARQAGGKETASRPTPFPDSALDQIKPLVLSRVNVVDGSEYDAVVKTIDRRESQWRKWRRSTWQRDGEEIGLLRPAGQYATSDERELSWATLQSMRNVDAECQAEITLAYISGEIDEEEDDA